MTMTATYSPDDNKLRLYSPTRLDAATYERVKAAGFAYAPRQQLFVAPMWTPNREDLLIELCGEIGDEDTSLVERAEERADRFDDYSDKRERDANAARKGVEAISGRFEFGQPILVGHHSERKARKDAERMESGMRRAVKMWETSQYWQDRAAGALAHAKYKERADVRARRIKGIEADKRKQEKHIAEAAKLLKFWDLEGLTMEQALKLANLSHVYRRYPLAEFPRVPPASQYEGEMSLWSALNDGVITVEQARAQCLKNYPRSIAWHERWLAHFENRLAYERAMLAEQGGLASDRFDIQVGGSVLVRGEWLTVMRVNKAGGRISSVSTNARYVRVRSIEEVQDYRAPAPELAEKVKSVTKVAPIANYPGEGFVHLTQAAYDAIYEGSRCYRPIAATDTTARHRVRFAMGTHVLKGEKDWNKLHRWVPVFITDAKRKDAPTLESLPAVPDVEIPKPQRVEPRTVAAAADEPKAGAEFAQMREQLREGIKVVSAPQLFPTPAELAERVVDLAGIMDGDRVLEPSAGTGRLIDALRATGKSMHIVAVEVNLSLSRMLAENYQDKPTDVPQEVEVITADFLEPLAIGSFDVVVMNPPFENASDIKHIQQAMKYLKPGGRLVSICANGPRQNAILKPLAEDSGGEWEDLPPDTFKSEGTSVRTALLSIIKSEETVKV